MNRLLLFFLFVGTIPLMAQRITLPKPVVIKVTATWCAACGSSSWDDFKFISEEFGQDAVILAVHASELSQLHSPTAKAIADNIPDRLGQPELFLDGEYVEGNWISGTRNYIEFVQTTEPVAHVFLSLEIVDNQIRATTTVKFLKDSNREHYLGLYVVENRLAAFQINRGPEEKHSKVLRTHFTENTFGNLISETDIVKDAAFDATYSMEIDTAWNIDNIELAAIIWEKVGERYFVTNANTSLTSLSAAVTTSLASSFLEKAQLTIHPTLVRDDALIQLSSPSNLGTASIELLDMNGAVLSSIYQGTIPFGKNSFALPIPVTLSNGVYLIRLISNGDSLIRKFIVKR